MIDLPTQVAAPARADAIRSAIRERARALGFDAVGFAAPDLPRDRQSAYRRFIAEGRHGDMAWLAREPERRQSPQRPLAGGASRRSCSGINYGPDEDPLAALRRRDRATISVYARHRDYHDLIKGRLKQLAGWLHAKFGRRGQGVRRHGAGARKAARAAAGIGWQGKHTNLVSRRFGSWLFLGEIFTDLRARAGSAGGRPLRQLPRLPGRLPDRRVPGALPARCAALHLLPHDRAPGPHPARVPRARSAIGSTAATTASRSAPGTSSRARASEAKLRARDDLRAPPPGRARPARRRRLPARALPARRSSAPGATGSCATS